MKEMNILIGSIVRLKLTSNSLEGPAFELLCTIWPYTSENNEQVPNNILYVDDTVRANASIHQFTKLGWYELRCEISSVKESKVCSSIRIDKTKVGHITIRHFAGLAVMPHSFVSLVATHNEIEEYYIESCNPSQPCTISNLTVLVNAPAVRIDAALERNAENMCITNVVSELIHRVVAPLFHNIDSDISYKGVLLYGPPGVGKTFSLQALRYA